MWNTGRLWQTLDTWGKTGGETVVIDTNLGDTVPGLFPHGWKDHTKQTGHKVGSLLFTVCFLLCGGKSQSLKHVFILKGTWDVNLFLDEVWIEILVTKMEPMRSNTWHRNESPHSLWTVSFAGGSQFRTGPACLCTHSGTAETFGTFVRCSVCSGLRTQWLLPHLITVRTISIPWHFYLAA